MNTPRPDQWARMTANRHPVATAIVVVGGFGVWAATGYPLPSWIQSLPPGAKVGLIAGLATAPVGVLAGRKMVDLLYDARMIYLVDVDGGDGDLSVYAVSPRVWQDVEVVTPGGERIDRSDLHRVDIDVAERAFEVIDFSRERRVAVSSPAAGLSEIDIRRHEHAVDHLISDLAPLADSYAELRSSLRPMIRSILSTIVTHQVSTLEEDDVPRGGVVGSVVDDEVDDIADEFPDPEPVDPGDDMEPAGPGTSADEPQGSDDFEWGADQ